MSLSLLYLLDGFADQSTDFCGVICGLADCGHEGVASRVQVEAMIEP